MASGIQEPRPQPPPHRRIANSRFFEQWLHTKAGMTSLAVHGTTPMAMVREILGWILTNRSMFLSQGGVRLLGLDREIGNSLW